MRRLFAIAAFVLLTFVSLPRQSTALSISLHLDGRQFAPGQSVYYWLTFYNDTQRDEYVVSRAVFDPASIELEGPDGGQVRRTGFTFCLEGAFPDAAYQRLGPGQRFVRGGNLIEEFDVSRTGAYRIRLNYANGAPERYMASRDQSAQELTGLNAPDSTLIVRGGLVSPEVVFGVGRPDSPVADLIERQIARADGDLSTAIQENASRILAEYPNSLYAADAAGARILRLLHNVEGPGLEKDRRFALAARMIKEFEAQHPKWNGLPYLYSQAAAQAAAAQLPTYVQEWRTRLQSRYPGHPAVTWLLNRPRAFDEPKRP